MAQNLPKALQSMTSAFYMEIDEIGITSCEYNILHLFIMYIPYHLRNLVSGIEPATKVFRPLAIFCSLDRELTNGAYRLPLLHMLHLCYNRSRETEIAKTYQTCGWVLANNGYVFNISTVPALKKNGTHDVSFVPKLFMPLKLLTLIKSHRLCGMPKELPPSRGML